MAKRPVKRRGFNLTSISDALVVAERSSIRGAARSLGIPQSVVSRRLPLNCGGRRYLLNRINMMTTQAKHTLGKASEAGQETTRRVDDTYLRAAQGATEYQRKALEVAQAHVDAAFDCAQ